MPGSFGGEYLRPCGSSLDRLEANEPTTVYYYVIHKVMAGLFDAYKLCGNMQAIDVLKRMAPTL